MMQASIQNKIPSWVSEKYCTVIVFFKNRPLPLKYHNCRIGEKCSERLVLFLSSKFGEIDHINFYSSESKKYLFQLRFNT